MAMALRSMVSKEKQRHIEEGYNLDLTYIRKDLIAMGFPAKHLEGIIRNNVDDIKRFLEEKHKGHYRVYNLCEEKNRQYDPKIFGNEARVETCIQFADHHPPKLKYIKDFCVMVAEWLSKDKENVAVVHCKAGKGRTGVMCCSYLIHANHTKDARKAINEYAEKRTRNGKGVTIPSQLRYVYYYGYLHYNKVEYHTVSVMLHRIRLQWYTNSNVPFDVPPFTNLSFDVVTLPDDENAVTPDLETTQHIQATKFTSQLHDLQKNELNNGIIFLELEQPLRIAGDVKISFYTKTMSMREEVFHLSFNTFFAAIDNLEVREDEKIASGYYDKIAKDPSSLPPPCPCPQHSGTKPADIPYIVKFPKKYIDKANKDNTLFDTFEAALILKLPSQAAASALPSMNHIGLPEKVCSLSLDAED